VDLGEDEADVRRALVDVAKRHLAGELGMIETCRRIDHLRHGMPDGLDEAFHYFINVADEALLFPLDRVRPLFNTEYLKEIDSDQRDAEQFYQAGIRKACEKLIEKYGVRE
jgi:hypothetical protein